MYLNLSFLKTISKGVFFVTNLYPKLGYSLFVKSFSSFISLIQTLFSFCFLVKYKNKGRMLKPNKTPIKKYTKFYKVAVFSISDKKELNIKSLFNLNYNIKESC